MFRSKKLIAAAGALALVVALAASGCGTRLAQSKIEAAAGGSGSGGSNGVSSGGLGTGSSGGSGLTSSGSTGGLSSAGGSGGSTGGQTAAGNTSGAGSSSGGGSISAGGSTGSASGSTAAGGGASSGGSSASPGSSHLTGVVNSGGTEAVGLTSCSPATGSPVGVGNTGTYSGVIGAVFNPALTGLELWVRAANACGGLNGHQIRLYAADDQGDPSTALTETQQQVQTDHVIAEVSVFSPFSGPTVIPYLQQQGIPEIGGCNCAPQNLWWSAGVYPAGAGWNPYGAAPASLAHAAGHNKVAIFYCIEAPSQCGSLASNSKAKAAQLGMSVVDEQAVSLTAPSFAAQCEAASAAKATALLVYLDGGSIQRMADDCASSVSYHPQFFTVGLAITPTVVSDSNLNGLEAPSQSFPWAYGGTPATAAYQNAIRQYDPSFSSAGPAAASWASGVLAQVGSFKLSATNPTAAQLEQGLNSLKNESLGGLVAPASYSANGAAPPTCVYINKIVNNRWTAPDGLQQLC